MQVYPRNPAFLGKLGKRLTKDRGLVFSYRIEV